jgi:hypothetical protein
MLRKHLEDAEMPVADRQLAGRLADAIFALEHPDFGGSLSDKVSNALDAWHKAWIRRALQKKPDIAKTVESLVAHGLSRSRSNDGKGARDNGSAYSMAAHLYDVSESHVIRCYKEYMNSKKAKGS